MNRGARRAALWSLVGFSTMWLLLRLSVPSQVGTPAEVLRFIYAERHLVLQACLETTLSAVAGLALASALSIVTGSLSILVPRVAGPLSVMAVIVKSTPAIAFVPLVVGILGSGYLDKIIISALISFFPMLVGIVDGARRVPSRFVHLHVCYGARRVNYFRWVSGPYALEALLMALKTAAPLAVVGAAVAGSLSGDPGGIGQAIFRARDHADRQVAWIVCSGVIGVSFYVIASLLHAEGKRRLRLHEL